MDSDTPIVLGDDPPERPTASQSRALDRQVEVEREAFWAQVRRDDARRHRINNNRYKAYGPPQFDSIIPPTITPRHPDPERVLPIGSDIPPGFPAEYVLSRYPSIKSAYKHLSPTAVELGFALVRSNTFTAPNGRQWQKFRCHMGPTRGQGENAEAYADERTCHFYITVINNGAQGWFKAYVNDAEHSHKARDPYGTPGILRVYLSVNDQWLRGLVELQRPPREIMARMQERRIPFKRQAVYQKIADIKKELRPHIYSAFPSQAALKLLEEADDISVPWIDSNGRLEGLLFASKNARALSQRFCNVFMIDITFKTNRYNLPLLHIVGKTNANTTFSSAVIILPNQLETTITEGIRAWKEHVLLAATPEVFVTDRERAIVNAIKTVFPDAAHVSCQWHVKRNVHKYALEAGNLDLDDADEFAEAWWEHVVHCTPRADQEVAEAVAEAHAWLERSFGNRPGKFGFRATLHYCKVDLAPLEPFFVDGYINQYAHLGNASTSPAEGNHAALKKWFKTGKPNLSDFVLFTRQFMNLQYGAWASEMSSTAEKPSRKRHERLRQVSD